MEEIGPMTLSMHSELRWVQPRVATGLHSILISVRGDVPLPRLHVQPLLLEPPEGATTTVLELEKLEPIEVKDGYLITIRLRKASYEFHFYSQNT